MIMTLSRRFL
jgi:hypothetical protein